MLDNYSLFKYQFTGGELVLGERPLAPKVALDMVMIEDFMRVNKLRFVDNADKRDMKREYLWTPEPDGRVTVFKLGYERERRVKDPYWNFKHVFDFPHCVVVLSTDHCLPYMLVTKQENDFENTDKVMGIMKSAINESLMGRGLSINIRPCDENDDQAKKWADYMFDVFLGAQKHKEITHNKIMDCRQKIMPKPLPDFRSFVRDPDKADAVVALIEKHMRFKSEPQDIFMPIAAACKANVIKKPSWPATAYTFHLSDMLESSFYRLTRKGCKTYYDDDFEEVVKGFLTL